ncbi:MAG: hypothetical protein NTV81_02205 [Candidatus Komeilibacteria bacterium]|nr:hypothetical protein [Candidatus Komeilibacteria bacterium]
MNKKFFSTQIILGVFIVSLAALSSVSAADWTPPPADPPGGWSLGAPIYSEGLTNQTIKGTLQIQSTGAYDLILNSIKSSAGDKYINLTGGGLRVDNSNVADIGLSVLTAQGNVGANQQLGYLVGLTNVGNGKGLYVSGAGTAIYGESTNQAVHGKINGAAAGSVAIYGENTLGTWAGYFLGDSAFQGRAAVTPDANFAFFNAGLQDGDLAAGRLCLITGAGGVNCINSWNGLGGGGGSSDSLWQLAGGILTPTSTANELTVTRGIINGGLEIYLLLAPFKVISWLIMALLVPVIKF